MNEGSCGQAPAATAELSVAAQLSELARVRGFVREMCQLLCPHLGVTDVDRLELAVHETTANIILHGYGGTRPGRIHVEMAVSRGWVRTRLFHQGDEFAPEAVTLPEAQEYREGGYGLYVIHHSVDEVRYFAHQQRGQCTELTVLRP